MSKRAFISRNLTADSPFRALLEKAGWAVKGQSLLSFRRRLFSWPVQADWIFFTSGKGVHYFLEGIPDDTDLAGYQLGCMGIGTARALEGRGRKAAFVGSGDPDEVAEQFASVAGSGSVLFPRGLHSRRSIQREIEGQVTCIDLIVYDNEPHTSIVIPAAEVYALTSPMNVLAFDRLTHGTLLEKLVIAIGTTTADQLRALGYGRIRIAAEPSEEGMAATLLKGMD